MLCQMLTSADNSTTHRLTPYLILPSAILLCLAIELILSNRLTIGCSNVPITAVSKLQLTKQVYSPIVNSCGDIFLPMTRYSKWHHQCSKLSRESRFKNTIIVPSAIFVWQALSLSHRLLSSVQTISSRTNNSFGRS